MLTIEGVPHRCVGRFTNENLPREILKCFYDIENLFLELERGAKTEFDEEKRAFMVEGQLKLVNREIQ